jgi:hypothetical protein
VLTSVSAQNNAAAPKVKVTVVVALASEKGTTVDKKLSALAKELQAKSPKLVSLQTKSTASKTLALNEKGVFATVDKKNVTVTVLQVSAKDQTASVAVTAPDQGQIVYSIAYGKFLPIVTRHQTKAKERLILAISVQPN